MQPPLVDVAPVFRWIRESHFQIMKIATWNVNSIRIRLNTLTDWLHREQPDIVLLQEIKCETAIFPAAEFEKLGYFCTVCGQKSYNGVATLTREKPLSVETELPGWSPEPYQARYVEVQLPYPSPSPFSSPSIRIGNLYAPNGNSGGEDGFTNKLAFFSALHKQTQTLLKEAHPFLIAGDYNICPTQRDYADGTLTPDDALIRPAAIRSFNTLQWSGLTDAVRTFYPKDTLYTFWDYQSGAWRRNKGLRIDHFMLSPSLAEQLTAVHIDKEERSRNQPSDHVPVWIKLGG